MNTLEQGLVGNGTIGVLIDGKAEVTWACFPRFDGDAMFCSLLRQRDGEHDFGYLAIDVVDAARTEQAYVDNTAVLVTRIHDHHGGTVEVTDFAPRFLQHGRMFCPMMLVRRIRRVGGSPRIVLRVRPAYDFGRSRPQVSHGSHHIRFIAPDLVLRLTTDASVTAILEEVPFFIEDSVTLLLGPDETVPDAADELGARFLRETVSYWRDWVSNLGIPFEWQDAVIRAAITLRLNAYEDTGAIIAAMTTSIPEAPGSGRNWDYRYCWLRDGYFVVNALNRLGATRLMDRFLGYVLNVVGGAGTGGATLQPVYRISGHAALPERELSQLAGYRGMGPVRVGNDAYRQVQHDVYGSAILTATHVFFDRRMARQGDPVLFRRLEGLGERAVAVWNTPDAGLWELRGARRVHTFSALMCWAACDRLARIAERLGLVDRAAYWRTRAEAIGKGVCDAAWNPRRGAFVATFGGESLDASLLLMHEIGFLRADDPRFAGTVGAIEGELKRGDFIFRYVEADDFGEPANAFVVCTYWYVYALAALGRHEEGRALFERMLARRSRLGLLAEHMDHRTGEQWGNFVQTYSMVGLINSAVRLSIRWDQAL